MSTYEPLLEFVDQTETFALGFEAGNVWRQLQDTDDEVTVLVHAGQAEMWMRMTEATRRDGCAGTELGDGWMEVWFGEVTR
jgi:hypothetical protein